MELLAPAGNFIKGVFAFHYGADAVYTGIKEFNLRATADNLTLYELADLVKHAHSIGKKVYLTMNIYFHNEDIEGFKSILGDIVDTGIDAIIMSDIGAIHYVRQRFPNVDIHVSTQANITNYLAADFLKSMGITRIILARELTFEEVREIKQRVGIEIEVFVHGAMCVSYSGRCLLSLYFSKILSDGTGKARDANRGSCSQPCRWEYYLMEKNRHGEYFPIGEGKRHTLILSSRDIKLVDYINKMKEVVDSVKIEGRMKSIYYTANTTRVYRDAIDGNIENQKLWHLELNKVSHRQYTTGFLFGDEALMTDRGYITDYRFIGYIDERFNDGKYRVRLFSTFRENSDIEIISPGMINYDNINYRLMNNEGDYVSYLDHQRGGYMIANIELKRYDIIREKVR